MEDKKYYVDFGPELLKLLGPNLYTNIYYVLGEIIANAYDADAKNVYIIYDTVKNSITVEDDGNGMSYHQFNSSYLPIGITSRVDKKSTYTESGQRKRMGRKGIGKLAALSVAERVKVTSIKNGEKSGCILSLNINSKNDEGRYEIPSIDENEIFFNYVELHGSAVIMENSRYVINKAIESAKKNISLIFPYTSEDFKIHLHNVNTGATAVIDDYIKDIVKLSDSLITFSDTESQLDEYFSTLHSSFNDDRYYSIIKKQLKEDELPQKKKLNHAKPSIRDKMLLKTIAGEEKMFDLVITGWIATYATSKDKVRSSDFPTNYISIIANGKLGQFDILPDISTDRMGESYVVGQFHVDILEETELPDIASSNRQGYKEDDPRYIKTIELIKQHALRPILTLKSTATAEKNYLREKEKKNMLAESKREFDRSIRKVVDDPSFKKVIKDSKSVKEALEKGWELKDTLRENYKKVMISHNSDDKELIDELEKALHYCGFEKSEVLYTSSSYHESGFSAYTDIYEYLRDFFVNTTLKPELCIIYILNGKFIRKWDPVLEAGAGWVLNSKWFPMFTDKFCNVKQPFSQTSFVPFLSFALNDKQLGHIADAIYSIANHAKKNKRTRDEIYSFMKSTKLYKYP